MGQRDARCSSGAWDACSASNDAVEPDAWGGIGTLPTVIGKTGFHVKGGKGGKAQKVQWACEKSMAGRGDEGVECFGAEAGASLASCKSTCWG